MPWEKSFDVSDAVENAMKQFWSKGYAATSLTDLIKATGINKGSLYNAFGDKRRLFVKALLNYDRDHRRAVLTQLENLDDPRGAIRTLFDGLVKESLGDKEKKGCLLVNTALELPAHDKEIQTIVTSGLRDFEAFFQRLIKLGQARTEIPDAVEPDAAAKTLVALVVGMRVLARGAFDEPSLKAIAEQAQRVIS